MKIFLFFISFFIFSCSCNSNDRHADTNAVQEKFDKTKWATKQEEDYPYRSDMLEDLISNQTLKGLKKAELLDFLGAPDRTDSSYLFYRISQKRISRFPLSTKTLVIKLAKDSTVEWRKVHG